MMKRAVTTLAVLAALVLSQPAWVRAAPKKAQPQKPGLKLTVKDIAALAERSEKYQETLPKAASLGISKIVAYEEHKYFVYILGEGQKPGVLRRMILLKPSLLVVDDRVSDLKSDRPLRWMLGESPPKNANGLFGVGIGAAKGDVRVSYHVLRPADAKLAKPKRGTGVIVDAPLPVRNGAARFVGVIDVGDGSKPPSVKSDSKSAPLDATVTCGKLTFKLTLPAGLDESGTIAIADSNGKALLKKRILTSGILPHGPKGVRMVDRWDAVYRRKNPAPWDTGKVASELKKVVEDGTIKPGRAVVLGCGTGTNSIYLASKGFDVTAIDIAPTALAMAQAKSDKAKVKVRWMLADVTAVPKLKPFDFIFDRGCYHGIRRGNARGFVKSACALSRAGTKFLILAGNANEARHYGPPRVKEKDIRSDFTPSFDFKWLKETKFGPGGLKGGGPLMWSILLVRKDQ